MSFAADSATKPVLTGNAAELFDELTLNDRSTPRNNTMRPPPPPPGKNLPNVPRSENVPPRGSGHGHRPSRSQEEAMRARRLAASGSRSKPSQDLDIFADPTEDSPKKSSDPRRVRRNSDSSLVDRSQKSLDPEEEKKRQERRRRDRERRHRERDSKDGGKARKPDRKLDIIDQLDATSIYGTGLFHHDGPFDACNPHRNRQGSRRAPMQAFPKDSLNNVIGGSGPLNKRPDHATFLGNNDEEAFRDYSKGGAVEPERPPVFRQESGIINAARVEPIHGDESLGLGTSTFLEGAPASKTAIQRRASEQNSPPEGLSRKKSLAQKIRGINGSRRDYGPSGRMTNPDNALYTPDPPVYTPGGTRINDTNPFFNEFSKGDDSKKEGITIVEPEKTGRARAPSSPRRGLGDGLQRRVTSDGSSGAEPPVAKPSAGSSFLSRVKSLKGGPRRPKADKVTPLPQEAE